MTAVRTLTRLFAPSDYMERLRRRLLQAGRPGGISPDGLLGIKLLSVPVALVIFGPLAVFLFVVQMRIPAFVVGALIPLGFFVPDMWLSARASSRMRAIQRALPDMLDMLTISVQAGLGFDMALAKLVRTTDGPLSYEFARMLNEVQAGVARRDALRHLADRTNVPEVNNFVVAMVQADIFGVSISGILREQSNELRTRRRQRAEEQAQKAPVKIVFPVIVCILPATLMVILGPAIVSIGRAFGLIQ
jgi:tight adherence protein C